MEAAPAVSAVRSYHPDWPETLGLSYAAVADRTDELTPEGDQAVAWHPLMSPWDSAFPDDIARMRSCVRWLQASADDQAAPS